MERSCPDWHLRPASLPLVQLPDASASAPDSAHAHALALAHAPPPVAPRSALPQSVLPPSPLMPASAPPSSIPLAAIPCPSLLPTHASAGSSDASVITACRTLITMLAAGGYTLISMELERTVLWKSRQTPDATEAAWQATHGLLSLLSRATCEASLRRNLVIFGRCVDLLRYRARSFVLSHLSAQHHKITWRSQPAHNAPAGTFSNQEEFFPVNSEPNTADASLPAVIVIHREERAQTRLHSGDTVTYMIPRNSQPWHSSVASDSAQQLITPPRTHIASPMQQTSQQLHQSSLAHEQVYGVERRTQPHQSMQQVTSAQDSLATNIFGVDERGRAPFPHARELPPLTGHASALPSVHELESRQARDEHLRSIPVLGLHSPASRSEPLINAQVSPIGRALSFGQALDSRPSQQDYLFGAAGLTQDQNPWSVGSIATMTTATTSTPEMTAGPGAVSASPSYIRRTRGGAAAEHRQCTNCSTRITRQWVRGDRSCWLCHSCGQFWRKNGYGRPAGLWNRPTFKRSRRKRSSTTSSSSTASNATAPLDGPGVGNMIASASSAAPSATVALTGVQPLLPHLGGGERGSQP